MSQKYRQPGYQDEARKPSPKNKKPSKHRGARQFQSKQMPSFYDVVRCTMCGSSTPPEIQLDSLCPKCKADLHTCRQCVFFDTSARFECTQAIPQRITKKDARNQCEVFVTKKIVERQTTSTSSVRHAPMTAREAFDALFKK